VKYELIDTQAEFEALMAAVEAAPVVALDTEAASFHRYHDRVYLVQLTVPGRTVVIDPLGLEDLAPLGRLLGDNRSEKVFHDADYDLRLFFHEYGFEPRNLFDTRIAAQFTAEPGIGLGALLEKYFNVRPDKRFQRADWSARPLTEGMLEYAAGDTHILCELRSVLRNNLIEMGRLSWAEEEFGLLESTRWQPGETDPRITFMKLKGARKLDRRALAILRELYEWREGTASRLDRASFRVLGNEVLFHLATHPVKNRDSLAKVRGVGPDALNRWGQEILAAISRGLAVPDDELPRFVRGPRRTHDPELEVRLEALKGCRNRLAEEFALQPGVLCPNGILEGIARLAPSEDLTAVPGMRDWQRAALGGPLLAAIANNPAGAA
jgi:ribonuclease D